MAFKEGIASVHLQVLSRNYDGSVKLGTPKDYGNGTVNARET